MGVPAPVAGGTSSAAAPDRRRLPAGVGLGPGGPWLWGWSSPRPSTAAGGAEVAAGSRLVRGAELAGDGDLVGGVAVEGADVAALDDRGVEPGDGRGAGAHRRAPPVHGEAPLGVDA